MPFVAELPEAPSLKDYTDKLSEAGAYLVGLRARRDKGDVTDLKEYAADARSAIDFIYEADALCQAEERKVMRAAGGRGPRGTILQDEQDMRSIGELTVLSENYVARSGQQAWNQPSNVAIIDIEGSLLHPQYRDLLSSTDADGGLLRPVAQPIVMPPRTQRLFLRDLMSVQNTGIGGSIPYIQELNPLVDQGGASAVAEGDAKPEVDMHWTTADAPIRKIAAWIPATTEILDDAPTLRGYIDTRLAYMLAVREEQELLSGSGTSPHLQGVLTLTGRQTQAAIAGDVPATIGMAIGLVENVEGEADGIALNPLKFWQMVTTRHADQFDGQGTTGVGSSGVPFGGPPRFIFGLPAVRSNKLAATKAIVGAFKQGATLFDRQKTQIRVGNQHSDYFTSNKIVVLAEERVGVAWHRPDFFVEVTLPA